MTEPRITRRYARQITEFVVADWPQAEPVDFPGDAYLPERPHRVVVVWDTDTEDGMVSLIVRVTRAKTAKYTRTKTFTSSTSPGGDPFTDEFPAWIRALVDEFAPEPGSAVAG